MFEYNRPEELDVNVGYDCKSGFKFRGRGLLIWKPEKGLNLEAFSNSRAKAKRWKHSAGKVQILSIQDARSLRVQIPGFGWGLVPNNFLKHQEDAIEQGRLTVTPDEMYFFHPVPYHKPNKWWCGTAHYLIAEELDFPDQVKSETTINGQFVASRSNGGLWQDDDTDIGLTGRNLSKEHFQLSWSLPKDRYTKTDCWRFGEAARRAFSIIFGQTIRLFRQEARRGGYEAILLRTARDVEKLGMFHRPLETLRSLLDQWAFNKVLFLQLSRFFLKEEHLSNVCYSIFRQMAESSRQKTWEARELLLSTILEATLRTLDNCPFKPKDHSWRVKQSMTSFRHKYLNDNWSTVCDRAIETRNRLRHRNAHPDWLVTTGGSQSNEAWGQAMKDINFLSQFYGYMILALAKIPNLEPKFREIELEF